MTERISHHRNDIVFALIEGEQSGISERTPEDIRAAVKDELRREERIIDT